jgi:hypothetical protein
MNASKTVCAVALAGLLSAVSVSRADEEKVALTDVPKAVMDSVMKKFPVATAVGASKETEDGKTTFEVELKDKGKSVDVSLKPDGTILEIETEVAPKDLPAAVTAAVTAKYPGSKIEKAESIVEFEDGKEEKSYEVVVMTAAKKSVEVKVSPAGKVLEDEDEDDEKEDKKD